MDTEMGLALIAIMASFQLEGIAGYPGEITHEVVVQSHSHLRECNAHSAAAAAAAPDPVMANVNKIFVVIITTVNPRQHALPQFSAEAALGKGGTLARETIQR